MGTRALLAGALAVAAALAAPGAAAAKDPGRWRLAKVDRIPFEYFQGVTASPARALFFSGTNGLFGTTGGRTETGRREPGIPPEVTAAEGYDHIGDLSYDTAEGGRLLLPLECYRPGAPNAGNHCGTGSIGVADPRTLQWRYYVKLDPAAIEKAMWNEVSPDGRWLYTQDGADLLRYDMAQVTAANAAPAGPALLPVQRVRRAFPFGQATGATFHRGRLLVAEYSGLRFRVWRIDTATGRRRLDIERSIAGESEGLATFGRTLRWQVMPVSFGRPPTYGANRGALLSFRPRRR
ncbi:MAG TPA: hypothetical protein VHF89_10735 [Solirubrobacteraceae bacterium]|nr:hypothetical protein [Solirubrobacteraceae bacterium]